MGGEERDKKGGWVGLWSRPPWHSKQGLRFRVP